MAWREPRRDAASSGLLLALPALALAGALRTPMSPRPLPPPLPAPVETAARSAAVGRPSDGRLVRGRALPPHGLGYFTVAPERGQVWGTDELVAAVLSAAWRMHRLDAETPPLSVGNLSLKRGGKAGRHLSHQNGRDADFGFYMIDESGRPFTARRFVSFDGRGRGRLAGRPVRFDTRRNWMLVRAFLTDPVIGAQIEFIFVSRPLRRRLLDYARLRGEPAELLDRAATVLREPWGDAHDQHFHLRLGCAPDDRAAGCLDTGLTNRDT